ncbi:T9SS type A sorting domain-containing protein [Flammeovirga aprica]|uniref:T9SS type A sorting domain-containing protein n=1 Tax=Flammeovirga aprica JL-4 TaxID=694437 RepID=A0A7X9XCM1_9BACT|nr:T9SS type A sorting domain-containing protein [Flammeovirga aprica]NME71952.1 T9SS type A sorting domain-containing protein [Flammeovirga aprica JL-4]
MRRFYLLYISLIAFFSCSNLEELPVGVKPNFENTEINIKNDTTINGINLIWSNVTIHENVQVDIITGQLTSSKLIMMEGASIVIHGSVHMTDVLFENEGYYSICGKEGVRIDVDGKEYIMPEGGTCFDSGDDLPVELLYFNTTLKEQNVLMEWATATEINNKGFAVERSIDKREWSEIAFVEGAGNSNSTIEYDFQDLEVPNASIVYYRLRQVDFDGAMTIYGPNAVSNSELTPELSIYPNPIAYGEKLNVLSNSDGFQVQLFDTSGRLYGQLSTENIFMEIPMIYGSGLFIVEVKSYSGNIKTEKVVVN